MWDVRARARGVRPARAKALPSFDTRHPTFRRAFTFVEMMIVLVVIGILAAIVLPKFGTVTDDAKTSALQSVVGGVRASVSAYRTRTVISGAAAYPTLSQLTTVGTVIDTAVEPNPFTKVAGVQGVSAAQAAARAVVNPNSYGWNYYVDNSASPPTAVFYANSDALTTATNGSGVVQRANQL